MRLKPKSVGIRAVDINKCLQNIEVSTPHIYFETIEPVGAAIRLSANIQGLDIIEKNQLTIIANNVGIKPSEINNVLGILTDLDYVNVIKDETGKLYKVEETVPVTRDCFEEAGKYIFEQETNPIEMGGVYSLEKTSLCPIPKEELKDDLNELNDSKFDIMLSCGINGQFLDRYDSINSEIIYSPYLWDIKDNTLFDVFSKLSRDEVSATEKLAAKIKGFQGIPYEKILDDKRLKIDSHLMHELEVAGILNVGSVVTSATGKKDFYFLPSDEMNIKTEGTERNDVFNKVKNVIACVRQGQYYAPTTRISKPRRLLESLLYDGIIGKRPHTDIKEQYGLLEIDGIARAENVSGDRYRLIFNRTEDNENILKAAITFFESETVSDSLTDLKTRLMVYGNFKSPEQNRIKAKQSANLGPTSINMLEVLRGEKHDLW